MFLESYGKNVDGEEVSFVAFSPEHLLELMQENNLLEVHCCTSEFGDMPITFKTFTVDDVVAWIERCKDE